MISRVSHWEFTCNLLWMAEMDIVDENVNSKASINPKDSLPWVEKYRPNSLEELIAHEEIIQILNKLIESNKLPHLLFHGPPGTGTPSWTPKTPIWNPWSSPRHPNPEKIVCQIKKHRENFDYNCLRKKNVRTTLLLDVPRAECIWR